MNVRDLDYICALAKHLHFGKAAEACHVSQPTLSGQIRKLEDTLGAKLFDRTNKSVRVTDIGEEIIAIAQEARSALNRMKLVAQAAQDPLAGKLSLGMIPTIAPYLIPLCARPILQDLPNLALAYKEDITERLTEGLLAGDLDLAILATPPETDRLAAIPLYVEPFWIVYPEGHDLRNLDPVKMGDVDGQEVLLLSDGHCFRDQALSICQTSPQSAVQATSLETLVNLVGSGHGVTLVPALSLRDGHTIDQGISAQKLSDKSAERIVYMTYRRQFPRLEIVNALADVICDNLPDTVFVVRKH
ncbi:MAG: LysR family transcriptional regulator [Acidimicrobiales bacterium]|nr:LysR family transcriptional regulator [Hyphomonadaceae bacterium]RZV43928.1 MAG: LysR family transcriptional regulator [Acidimicrobiales bacterium]